MALQNLLEEQTADDILEQLGGVVEVTVSQDSIYDQKTKAMYDAEPKVPVFIPTPDGYTGTAGYAEYVNINGVGYIINADQMVLVPQSVKAVLDNKREMERTVRNKQSLLKRKMSYTHIDQVAEYIP